MEKPIKIGITLTLLTLATLPVVSAQVEIDGAVGEWVHRDIDYSYSDVGEFYADNDQFEDDVYFYYDENNDKLGVTIHIPDLSVGTYTVPVYLHRAYPGTNNTYEINDSLVTNLEIRITEAGMTNVSFLGRPQNKLKKGETIQFYGGSGYTSHITVDEINPNQVSFDAQNCEEGGFTLQEGQKKNLVCGVDGECSIELKPRFINVEEGNTWSSLKLKTNCNAELGGNETGETGCGTVQVSVIGQATRGKTMLVHATNEDGEDIIAKTVMSDPEGNTDAFQTNNPFKGYGQVFIPEDSDVPLILLASKEGCKTGRYQINELKGQLIEEEEEEEEPEKALIIKELPNEALVDTIVNATLMDSEGNLITGEKDAIQIKDPDGGNLKTNTDSSGKFKFYAGKLGNYEIKSTVSGYQQSDNHTVKVRKPRKEITVLAFRGGERISSFYQGQEIDLGVYHNDEMVDFTGTGKAKIGGRTYNVNINNGKGKFQVPEGTKGTATITVPQTEEYTSAELRLRVKETFNFMGLAIPIIAIIIVIVIAILLIRWRSGGREGELGQSEKFQLSTSGKKKR